MSTTPPPLDLNNVQGDILSGLLKKLELTLFFQIGDDVDTFRKQLSQVIPLITTTTQAQNNRATVAKHKQEAKAQGRRADTLPIVGVSLAFSQFGLNKLGITDAIGDNAFINGQLSNATALGDIESNWLDVFKNGVHGVFIIAGDSTDTINGTWSQIEQIFGLGIASPSINEVFRVIGNVRPDTEKGHEHFGFLDGISNPAVQDVDTTTFPGQETVPQGIMLLGRTGDQNLTSRPSWALDGSFLAFRYLSQLVPEFNSFLDKNPIPGLPPADGSALLGARLVGRWKSGAPVDLAPTADDPALGADPQRNNNFRYDFPDDPTTQDRCPFAAHLRKTNPRNDLGPLGATTNFRIIRRGIPFGPELTDEEKQQQKTLVDRGLLFRCYQSVIDNGFNFIQKNWANNTGFPFGKPIAQPGFDPIIGQVTSGTRSITGTDPNAQTTPLPLPAEWVVSKGGEYFFSPSIPALRTTFALAA
ncbi:peroxidase TAP [Panus rudis PR-1116 ss-1]|nr:peroxidase TAP [Panus rudis PR-1116 ss-1]